MTLVVKSRELKWAGETLLRGAKVEPKSDRDRKHLDLLLKIGKVEEAPAPAPARHAATVQPRSLKAEEPAAEPEAPPAEAEPKTRTYRRRDLKAED
jgi:hypothetical protein